MSKRTGRRPPKSMPMPRRAHSCERPNRPATRRGEWVRCFSLPRCRCQAPTRSKGKQLFGAVTYRRRCKELYIPRYTRIPRKHRFSVHCRSSALLGRRSWEGCRRFVAFRTPPSSARMASNVDQIGSDHPSGGGGPSPTSTGVPIDGLSGGSDPSGTIRSSGGPNVRSKLGSLNRIKSLGIGAGIWSDVRARFSYYSSDWTDAWNYRVIPATTLIFFAKCALPFPERPHPHGPF